MHATYVAEFKYTLAIGYTAKHILLPICRFLLALTTQLAMIGCCMRMRSADEPAA